MSDNNSESRLWTITLGMLLYVMGKLAAKLILLDRQGIMNLFKQKTTWAGLASIFASVGHAVATQDYVSAIGGVVAGIGLITAADSATAATKVEVEQLRGDVSASSRAPLGG